MQAWWGLAHFSHGSQDSNPVLGSCVLGARSDRYSVLAMSGGEIVLEPEVVEWFYSLTEEEQSRVGFHLDRLVAHRPLLSEPYTKQLDGKRRELRFSWDRGRHGSRTRSRRGG